MIQANKFMGSDSRAGSSRQNTGEIAASMRGQLVFLLLLESKRRQEKHVRQAGIEWQNFSRNGKILLPKKYERWSAKLHTLGQQSLPCKYVTAKFRCTTMPSNSLALSERP